MMFFSRTVSASRRESLTRIAADARPTFSGSVSKTAAMLIPCSAKIGELAIAWPSRPAPIERDVVLALRAQDLADLAEQRVDVVADPALAELAEAGEVAPDLRRVDVRVVGDLLRGDALLAHLLRLGQHLEIAGQPRRDADRQPSPLTPLLGPSFVTPHAILPVRAAPCVGQSQAPRSAMNFVRLASAGGRRPRARSRRRPARRRSRPPGSSR